MAPSRKPATSIVTAHKRAQPAIDRRGSLLIMVLVVVAMLTLGAYTFSEIMISESEATAMFGRQAESRAFAYSGIEHVTAVLGYPETPSDENIYHNPTRYQAVLLRDSENARGRGFFSIVAAIESDPTATAMRFGLIDESGKLNLNQIQSDQFGLDEDELTQRDMLMYLPNMTPEVADAILDWVDSDDIPRQYGVESDYYQSVEPPYYAKNGSMESIDELLMVAGVTPELLYGEDQNRNGLLDANENDGGATLPFDNADGILDAGWSAFLTTNSKELNQRSDGEAKIFVNNGVLTELYDTLAEEFDEDVARFVVAYRMYGSPQNAVEEAPDETAEDGVPSDSGESSSGNTPSGSGSGNSDSGNSGSGNSSSRDSGSSSGGSSEPSASDIINAAEQVGNALGGAPEGSVTRGGLDLSAGGKVEIKSLYELFAVTVEVPAAEEAEGQGDGSSGPGEIIESPWADDPGSMESYIPLLFDMLAVTEEKTIQGRINVNQARYEVLLGVPGITEDIAAAVSSSSMVGADGAVSDDQLGIRATTGWLVTQGIVDLPTMIELDKFLTGGGKVYRAQVIGYFEEGGGFTRLEAVLDATESPVRILRVSDLTELGRGYRQDMLNGTVAEY